MSNRASASSPGVFPKTANPRPPLPPKWNKFLVNSDQSPTVKFQPIRKDNSVVIIGRVKVPTPSEGGPSGHAYILRRFDTGYISLTTMWRAAFPSFVANSHQEKDETNWVKSNFDLTNAPGEKMRLAGVWIPLDLARYLAPSYNLSAVVTALAEAQPNADAVIKAMVKPEEESPGANRSPNGPNKRRKESQDTPGTNGVTHATTNSTTKSPSKTKGKSPPPTTRRTPTRSVKSNKAPSPSPSAGSARKSGRTSRVSVAPAVEKTTEEEEDVWGDAVEKVTPPLPVAEQDIVESRNLVERLKVEQVATPAQAPRTTVKRAREEDDAPISLNLGKSSQDVDLVPPSERAVITNRRIQPGWPNLEPNQKAAAWGTLAFAIGWGAATFLPQFM